jgi:superfamily II DNA or RNA helicase
MFKNHDDLVVIATVHIAGTGLSINRIFNLILIDIGKSFIRVIQAIGRGLRKAHDKNYVNITDVCSDFKYSKTHLATRIRYYKDAKYPYKKHTITY